MDREEERREGPARHAVRGVLNSRVQKILLRMKIIAVEEKRAEGERPSHPLQS